MSTLTPQPVVHVLLSTYNGAPYLAEQMDSLLAQDYPKVMIHVRDDGSADNTVSILKLYAGSHTNIHIAIGPNLGVRGSFYELLLCVRDEDGFFAFCDQDDVWNVDKISAAVKQLGRAPDPESSLYMSRVVFANAHLSPMTVSALRNKLGFGNAIVEIGAIGCTMAFGKKIRDLMIRSDPSLWNMHDTWIYLVASAFGHLVFDPQPKMLYRRHGSNASGWDSGIATRMAKRFALFLDRYNQREVGMTFLNQAARFSESYKDIIGPDKQAIIQQLLDMRSSGTLFRRLTYVLRPSVWREKWAEDVALRLLILLRQH